MLNIAFCDDDKEFLLKTVTNAKEVLMNLKINTRIYAYTDGNYRELSHERLQQRISGRKQQPTQDDKTGVQFFTLTTANR
jgi:hypothetical protein